MTYRTRWYNCELCNSGFWALDIVGPVDTCVKCCRSLDDLEPSTPQNLNKESAT